MSGAAIPSAGRPATAQERAKDDRWLFADAHEKVENALAAHYSTGDYVPLGMALQDVATEVLQALRFASAHVELMRHAGFHSGRIVHGDAE